MDKKLKVLLIIPTKVDGQWFKPGVPLEVDEATAKQLRDAGVLAPSDDETPDFVGLDANLLFTADQFEVAVQAEARKLAGQAFDGLLDKLEAEAKSLMDSINTITAAKVAALDRAIAAEAQRDALQARVDELQAAATDTSAKPEAAAAVPKKGKAT